MRRSNEEDRGRVIATWMRASQWSLLAAALRRLAIIALSPALPAELRREESEELRGRRQQKERAREHRRMR